jgi:very-short-patch-repair endonuclease
MAHEDIALRKRGRKRKYEARIRDAYDPSLNKTLGIEDCHNSSTKQLFFKLECGRHCTLMTPQALAKNKKALQGCSQCQMYPKGGRRHASKHEQVAYMAIAEHVSTCHEVMTEVKILREKYGAADICLPQLKLIIAIDGEQHFARNQAEMFGEPVQLQQQRDADFNARACQLGFVVLRLHHLDTMYWQLHIARAIEHCRRQPLRPGILYTLSYGCSD